MPSSGSCITYKFLIAFKPQGIHDTSRHASTIHDEHTLVSAAERYKIYLPTTAPPPFWILQNDGTNSGWLLAQVTRDKIFFRICKLFFRICIYFSGFSNNSWICKLVSDFQNNICGFNNFIKVWNSFSDLINSSTTISKEHCDLILFFGF